MKFSDKIVVRVMIMLMLALTGVGSACALNLFSGSYCFDNSKLHFNQVKMIVGNVTNAFTRV